LEELKSKLDQSKIYISVFTDKHTYYGQFNKDNEARFENLSAKRAIIEIFSAIHLDDTTIQKSARLGNSFNLNDSITIKYLTFPEDCDYNRHLADKKCPNCQRTETVVPIIYGLLRDFPPIDFQPGGCMVTNCDPSWFCKQDKISF
jgi:hypothetical protein